MFDRHNWLKRSRAFEHVIFPSCARRVILQKRYGYHNMIAPTLNAMFKILKVFVQKLIAHEAYKAYYVLRIAFFKFLDLIGYIPKEDMQLALC